MIELVIEKKLIAASGVMNLNIQVQIEANSFVAIYGKSGAGKTSLLRLLAGLLTPDAGKIVVEGIPWFSLKPKINLAIQKRAVGMVFQDYALFPNMTVRENLRFALGKGHSQNIIQELLDLMELDNLQNRKPNSLSGGQQQRVALARALVQQPKILLLDEPLSALDYQMRVKLQNYLVQAHRKYQLTTILVSHDIPEIIKLADQVLIMEHGSIVQQGEPLATLAQQQISGKFQFIGEIVAIYPQDFLNILHILIGKETVRIIADEQETIGLMVGDRVLVASKAFNPIIKKIG